MGKERMLVTVDMMGSGRIFGIFGMDEKGQLQSSGGVRRKGLEGTFQIDVVDDNNMHKYVSTNWVHLRNIIVMICVVTRDT